MLQDIAIEDILVEKSRFLLKGLFTDEHLSNTHLINSFDKLGILTPIVVYREKSGKFHLVDGKKRVLYAKQKQIPELKAVVLPDTPPFTEIVDMILYGKSKEINSSVINKVQFVCFALSLGVTGQWALDILCKTLGFRPHSGFLNEIKKIDDLPEEFKSFCHEKKFSLKQALNLANYPEDILLQLLRWKSCLQLTASTMEEVASNLRDYLKDQDMKLGDFVSAPEVQEIMQSSLSPHVKTERFRQYLYRVRFPILSGTNEKIKQKVKKMNLPDNIVINWDTTLENKKIDMTISIQKPEQLSKILKTLNSEAAKNSITEILDEL